MNIPFTSITFSLQFFTDEFSRFSPVSFHEPGQGWGIGGCAGFTVRATVTVAGEPDDGVMVTIASYAFGARPVLSTVKVSGELAPAGVLPLVGVTDTQVADGVPTVHCKWYCHGTWWIIQSAPDERMSGSFSPHSTVQG